MKGELTGIDLRADEHKEVVRLLQHHLPDTEVWAYGSRVKGTARPASDLDLVTFASAGQKEAVSRLREAFDESPLPFRVDLFVWDKVPEEFRKNIEEARVVVQKEKTGCELPEGWQQVILGDVITINDATYSSKDKWPFINYLDTGNLTNGEISEIKNFIIGTDKIPSRAKRKIQPGDIVYSTVRPNQKHFGIIKDLPENLLVSTAFVTIRGKKEKADTNFVYFLLTQRETIEILQTIGEHSTSAYPSIKPSDIEALKFNLPPLPEQKAIAHILGSLDDKIELNRRMNETLEAMAQALFKSWFVDFDPVIDNALAAGNLIPDELKEKAAIRQGPGDERESLPDDIRRLFPSEFAYTEEMGWIPKGWEIKNLDQIGVFKNGLALQKFPPIEGEEILPVVKIAQLRKGNATGSDLFASRIADDFIINDGDFIFSWSGSLLAKFWVGGKGALNQHLFKVEGKEHPLWFVAGWVHQHMPEFCAIAENKATTMGHIKKEHLSQAQCIGPGQKVLKKLEVCIAQLINRQIFVQQESRALAELRDTLLPKLLSAKIGVEQAKQMLEVKS